MIDERKVLEGQGYVRWLDKMGSEVSIVNAARVSYGKRTDLMSEKDKKLLKYLWSNRHTSPFEKVQVSFEVKCPIPISKQWMRHRTWCLAGDTIITINRPDRWKKGQHCVQTRHDGKKHTIKNLYNLFYSSNKTHIKQSRTLLVRVYNTTTKKFEVSNINDIWESGKKPCYKITLENGKTLQCTKEHRIFTKKGWETLEEAVGILHTTNDTVVMSKKAEVLTNGTSDLYTGTPLAGIFSKVIKIEYVGIIETYDMEISGENNNYVANGIVVHNSYNEISRRYTNEDIEFYIPENFRKQDTKNKQGSLDTLSPIQQEDFLYEYEKHCNTLKGFYDYLIRMGVANEQARFILPQGLMTSFVCSVNMKNLMDFLRLRMDEHAQYEIRVYAEAIFDMLKEEFPMCMGFVKESLK